ncbi:MAG: hypothetical protein ICV62_02080 [Cyanobacteria bacterium Co-bin13]|nr:hypothetical protein [Cyanobacteria bacterium Co-bin13]
MEREVTDGEGITWTCIQALSGISEEAAQVKGKDAYWVVCTPSGGAQSVRVQLGEDWQTNCSDEDLLQEIAAAQED